MKNKKATNSTYLFAGIGVLGIMILISSLLMLFEVDYGTLATSTFMSIPKALQMLSFSIFFCAVSVYGIFYLSIASKYISKDEFDAVMDEYEQYKKESIKWGAADLVYRGNETLILIEPEIAQIYLEDMIADNDCNNGITWQTIDFVLERAVQNGDAYPIDIKTE